jgi:hypothetical protein
MVPYWHDMKNQYSPIETLIGELTEGCGFGELAMNIDDHEKGSRKRNYSAVALAQTVVI